MFYLNGSGQMFVFSLTGELKQVAINEVTTDKEIFWGSPAVSNGRLVLRSSKHLYCVADKGETVAKLSEPVALTESPPAAGSGGSGGRGRFDPMSMFNSMDADKNGRITAKELEGNRMAERLMTLDKDDDKAISAEEFRTGITSLFSRGGGGGRGSGGSGNYQRNPQGNRPDRPQRPAMAGE